MQCVSILGNWFMSLISSVIKKLDLKKLSSWLYKTFNKMHPPCLNKVSEMRIKCYFLVRKKIIYFRSWKLIKLWIML